MRLSLAAALLAACSSNPPESPSVQPADTFVAPPSTPEPQAAPIKHDAPVPRPSWSLTASDGSGLRLVSVEAKAVAQGPLAYTELHLRFENPEKRVREGTFAITLPQGAAVSRFAMEDAGGHMVEAEVVPKGLARRAYDDALHRGVDPAILEKAAGNEFTARVFPIPAGGIKHLVISYSQELAGEGYRLPLRGLPKIDSVAIDLDATAPDGSIHVQRMREAAWQPDEDFVATVTSPAAVGADGVVAGAFEIAQATAEQDPPTALAILVDTSASRAPGFANYATKIERLIAALPDVPIEVVAFDQVATPIYRGRASQFGDAEVARLVDRGAAGASDLGSVLAGRRGRIVVIGDGVATAGGDVAKLKLDAERVDVVLAGGIRDDAAARALTRAGKRPGDVFDLDRALEPIAKGLGEVVRVDVPIEVAGATWSYPKVLPTLRAGTQVVVLAKLASPATELDVAIDGAHRRTRVVAGSQLLLARAAAGAEIAELEDKLVRADADAAAKLRHDIAEKSVASRVVSSQTTMLVLEHDDDYARYGIDRKALADVLVVGKGGIEPLHRTFVATPAPTPVPSGQYKLNNDGADPQISREQAIEQARNEGVLGSTALTQGGAFASLDSTGDVVSGFDDTNVYGGLLGNEAGESNGGFGYGRAGNGPGGGGTGWGTIGTGSYGTIGHGAGTGTGYGAGGGRGGLRGRTANAPSVSISQPTVDGDLDRAIIRRYVRRQAVRLSYCYEHELLANPDLAGTITARFLIGTDGTVSTSEATGFDATVASCVASTIKDIEFPKPRTGVVQVSYPLEFQRPGPRTEPTGPRAEPTAVSTGDTPPVESMPADGLPPFGPPIDALDGDLARVTIAINHHHVWDALAIAHRWVATQPTNVLAWVALGQALEANGDVDEAQRAYGSIIDLYPSRAEYRRFAGERLERTGARALAIDTYARAVADRPDQITGHRLLAYAKLRAGDAAGAWEAILAGADTKARADSYAGAARVFADDVRIIGTVYAAHGGPKADIADALAERGLDFATPSVRFILYWETDANDVDLHVKDAAGHHAYFQHKHLESGGDLYADITTGFGPECFAIDGTPSAGPYELGVHYYAQGPMGYGMGLLQIERFDGTNVAFDDRPYVIMKNQAYVALGRTP